MSNTPACSVIVPAYKTTEYIAETMDSIFAQTFQDFEIVVANDGCPDTENLERVLAPYMSRIVYVKQANGGLGAARNLAIRASSAPVLAMLDSDDIWKPEYLETQMAVLAANPKVDMACCDAEFFGDGQDSGRLFSEVCPSEGEINFQNIVTEKVHVFVSVTGRKSAFEKAGLFFQLRELHGSEDYAMWSRVALHGSIFHYTNKPLVRYRRRATSISASDLGMVNSAMNAMKAIRSTEASLTAEQKQILDDKIQHYIGKRALFEGKRDLQAGNYESAKTNLMLATRHYDSSLRLRVIAQLVRVVPGLVRALAMR